MLRKAIRRLLGLSERNNTQKPALSYISAVETVRNANTEGLSVGDYVEKLWGQVGQSEKVIDQMMRLVQLPLKVSGLTCNVKQDI